MFLKFFISFSSLINFTHRFPIAQCSHSIFKQWWQYHINKEFLSGNISTNHLKAKILSLFSLQPQFSFFIKDKCIERTVIWRHFFLSTIVTDIYYGICAYKSFCAPLVFAHAHSSTVSTKWHWSLRFMCSVTNCAHVRVDYARARIQSTMMPPGEAVCFTHVNLIYICLKASGEALIHISSPGETLIYNSLRGGAISHTLQGRLYEIRIRHTNSGFQGRP